MKNKNCNWGCVAGLTALALGMAAAQDSPRHGPEAPPPFAETHRFVFYSVLEGCFEDGLSAEDVSQILRKDGQGAYLHFIYGCPLCLPTVQALETYQSRPPHFYGLKSGASTFGSGLTSDLQQLLYRGKTEERFVVINSLLERWVSRRKSLLRLSAPEQTRLQNSLESMRQAGMECLKRWKTADPARFKMSAFASVQQCAVCNGACGIRLKTRNGP